MNYLIKKIDDTSLLKSIGENSTKYNKDIILCMSNETATEIENKNTIFFTPEDNIIMKDVLYGSYAGCKVIEDNTLVLGEIKQYIEV